MSTLLVLLVKSCLLNDHLLEKVLLSFVNEHFSEALLMLFDSQPVLMVDLGFRNVLFIANVHVQNALINDSELRLLDIISELYMRLIVAVFTIAVLSVLCVQVFLSRLVETFQQALVLQILPLLFVQIRFILFTVVAVVILVVFAGVLRLLPICEVAIVLVSLFELSFLLEVDDFGVVDTDGAAQGLSPDDLVDQVHGLRGQLNALDCLLLAQIGVDESDGVRVLVFERCCWDHVEIATFLHALDLILLSFGAHRDHFLIFESGAGHCALVLLSLKSPHDLVLLDSAEVVLIGDS